MDDAHKGQTASGSPQTSRDRRVDDLVDEMDSRSIIQEAQYALMHDMHHGMGLEAHSFDRGAPPQFGKIVYAQPHTNWYRVQLDRGTGDKGCCLLSPSGLLPLGARATQTMPVNSQVLVYAPKGLRWGIVLGSVPSLQVDPKVSVPDFVSQGTGAGIKREKAYVDMFKRFFREGGIIDFSAGRPLDGTMLDAGTIAETGIAFHIDPFMAHLRVNEMCGIFLNYFDSHCRLAGIQLEVMSAVHEMTARDDEGESRIFHGAAAYPWEALGLFAPDTALTKQFTAKESQIEKQVGATDLDDDDQDIMPIYRYQEFGGYLGQGRRRTVMVPGRQDGKQKFRDDGKSTPDIGVWEETIGLDGAYAMRSAKSVFIGKRLLIPVVKERRLPEDQKTGDSKKKGNYKFSGQFGDGDDHVVKDVPVEGDLPHLRQVSGIHDLLSYHYNWKGLHPFHYHKEDYTLPEEGDQGTAGLTRAQDTIDFGELAKAFNLPFPDAKKIKVDHRYGDVDYFQREAFFAMLPDGGIAIGDGYGAQITLSGGSIRFECPGDVHVTPGRSLVVLGGDDIILRAHHSVDVSAALNDVRLKAQRNMQLLSGNGGAGGMLLECKAAAEFAGFQAREGEDVESGGIMFKSKFAPIVSWGSEIYLRTGGDTLGGGPITLDAAKGSAPLVLRGAAVEMFAKSTIRGFIGPADEASNVTAAFSFDNRGAALDKGLLVNGNACVDGSFIGSGSLLVAGSVGSETSSPDVVELKGGTARTPAEECGDNVESERTAGGEAHAAIFPGDLYDPQRPGNEDVIKSAEFSYRDDPAQDQYNTSDFQLFESRWQMLSRQGLGTGGTIWAEPPVEYQGREQMPWPGIDKWRGDTLLQIPTMELFDPATGRSADRSEDAEIYQEAKLAAATGVAPETEYKVIL